MHHLISNDTSFLSVTPAIFEEQCRMLAEKGWFGIGLDQAEDFLINGTPLPEKSFLLTFDDGFLDNYVYAWPIMRKYGHKGVVFVVTGRITEAQLTCAAQNPQAQNLARPTIEDVWSGKCTGNALPKVDSLLHKGEFGQTVRQDLFLNWDEARLLEQSGVMSIAAHSVRHASVFAGPSFSGFLQPGDKLRPFIDTVPPWCWGMPAFERVPEFAGRGFIPSPSFVEAIKKLVPQDEGAARDFFGNPQNAEMLAALAASRKDRIGGMESDADMARRMTKVMQDCQDTLTRELGHPVKSFCWPWGVFCDEARQHGLEAGFEVFYSTKIGINLAARPLAVHRFKAKCRADSWLLNRLRVYSRPLLGGLYLKLRI